MYVSAGLYRPMQVKSQIPLQLPPRLPAAHKIAGILRLRGPLRSG